MLSTVQVVDGGGGGGGGWGGGGKVDSGGILCN